MRPLPHRIARLVVPPCAGLRRVLLLALAASWSSSAPANTVEQCPGLPEVVVTAPLPRAAARLAAGEPLRVLAIGSSTTAGFGLILSPAYPKVQMAAMQRLMPDKRIQLTAAGRSGETAVSTVERLLDHLASGAFDLVVWQVGTNDYLFGASLDGLREQLRRGIEEARRLGIDLVLLDQQHFPAIRNIALYEEMVGAVEEAGRRHGVPVVSRYRWMKAAADAPVRVNLLAIDRFHNNGLGHLCIGEGLAQAIVAALTAPPPPPQPNPPPTLAPRRPDQKPDTARGSP